jgi:hypothetical protein
MLSDKVPFQPTKAIFVSVDVLLAVRIFCTLFIYIIVIHWYARLPMA